MVSEDFSDWAGSGLIEEIGNGSNSWTDDSNPAEVITEVGANSGALYRSISVSQVSGQSLYLYGKIKSISGTTDMVTAVYLSDGTTFVRLAIAHNVGKYKVVFYQASCRAEACQVSPPRNDEDTWTVNQWVWTRIKIDTDGALEVSINDTNSETKPGPDEWTRLPEFDRTQVINTATEMGVFFNSNNSVTLQCDFLEVVTTTDNNVFGFDAAIKFDAYYMRTALNGGGNARFSTPAPFYTAVSVATMKAQLKKKLSYINNFGIKQWEGEVATLDIRLHGGSYEGQEILRKTQSVEVGDTPIIFSTFIRQWDGLVIADKDAGFLSRGVTTSHIVGFEKADKKIYEGRNDSDTYTIVEDDFTTPFVPNQQDNDKDESMYYYDDWNSDDTDNAHIILDDQLSIKYAVKYPINVYEKFNNITKLNRLVIKVTMSPPRIESTSWTTGTDDDGRYLFYMFNYRSTSMELIDKHGKGDFQGNATDSTVEVGAQFYNPIAFDIDIVALLRVGADNWETATEYTAGDRVIQPDDDILYTCISNNTSGEANEPPNATFWQRTVYDFINYATLAASEDKFSKQNTIFMLRTWNNLGGVTYSGFWMWDLSIQATYDEDNNPEFSSAKIAAIAETFLQLTQTSGVDLPEEDGFGVGDIIHITRAAEDYLQDTWDASPLLTNLGALIINITNGTSIGVFEDHTYKSFFTLLQHISQITNSTFWADYDATNRILISSADNHVDSGITLTRDDVLGYNESNWSISYDATRQKNKIRIIGNNVNFIKTLSPALDPFSLGDETAIEDDPNIATVLQASDLADSLTPQLEDSEVIVQLTLDYSNPNQSYAAIEVGVEVTLKLPTASDTSIANFSAGNDGRLLIIATETNRNFQTGDKEHVILTLQRRYS